MEVCWVFGTRRVTSWYFKRLKCCWWIVGDVRRENLGWTSRDEHRKIGLEKDGEMVLEYWVTLSARDEMNMGFWGHFLFYKRSAVILLLSGLVMLVFFLVLFSENYRLNYLLFFFSKLHICLIILDQMHMIFYANLWPGIPRAVSPLQKMQPIKS